MSDMTRLFAYSLVISVPEGWLPGGVSVLKMTIMRFPWLMGLHTQVKRTRTCQVFYWRSHERHGAVWRCHMAEHLDKPTRRSDDERSPVEDVHWRTRRQADSLPHTLQQSINSVPYYDQLIAIALSCNKVHEATAELPDRTALSGIAVQHADHGYSRRRNHKYGNFRGGSVTEHTVSL